MEARQTMRDLSFELHNFWTCGYVIMPNRQEYADRIEAILACVKALRLDHNFVVNNDTVTIRLN